MTYRIMIVEDDAVIASLLQSQLCRFGYDAFVCEDLSDVMSVFVREKPHLLLLDVSGGRLLAPSGEVPLTRNELRILQALLEHKGVIISRDMLMQRLWDSDCFIDDNTLTVNVARLRKKLEENGLPGFILTKKGQGYLVERT